MINVLYVFGGEKASGAEKVIDRLIKYNTTQINAHLFIAPGTFASELINNSSAYKSITLLDQLKKLNRSTSGKFSFFLKAIKNYFTVSYRVCRYVTGNHIRAVHANTIVPASYLLPAIFWLKIFRPKTKFLWSDHDLTYFSAMDHKLAGLCVRFYDLTLVVSDAVKNKYAGNYQNKVLTLYNGLDTTEFKANKSLRDNFCARNNITSNDITIGLAGTIEPRKGQLGLIRVFNKLNVLYPNTCLLLAGSGSADYPEYTADVLSEINKNNHIIYLGRMNDMVSFYNGSDIIVNNSSTAGGEPLGTTIYEAMAMGKIVLASDTGGTTEIINDNMDGIIFNADNENELLAKLIDVLNNFDNLQHLTKNARKKVEVKFNISTMAEKYNLLLDSLTGVQK